MGRRLLFQPEELDDIAYELAERGYSDRKISRTLGIHYNTLLNYKKREAFVSLVIMLQYGRNALHELRIMEAFWRVFKVERYMSKKMFPNVTRKAGKSRTLDKNTRLDIIRQIIQVGAMPNMSEVIEQTPDIDLRALKTYYKLKGVRFNEMQKQMRYCHI